MLKQTSNNIEYDCWLQEQIDCLKSQNFAGLDLKNLIEELESLGRAEKSAVKSFTLQIIIHLLLIDYWSEESQYNRSCFGCEASYPKTDLKNHWQAEVNTFKFQLTDKLTTNLKLLLEDNLDKIYVKARTNAILKSNLSSDRFPEICPYTLEDLIDENDFSTFI
jgi:hypothetical protein